MSKHDQALAADARQTKTGLPADLATLRNRPTELEWAEGRKRKASPQNLIQERERTAELARVNAELQMEITERKLVEEKLRRSEEQLRLITDNVPVLITYFDAEQRIGFVNRTCETWFGRPASDMVGKLLREIFTLGKNRNVRPCGLSWSLNSAASLANSTAKAAMNSVCRSGEPKRTSA